MIQLLLFGGFILLIMFACVSVFGNVKIKHRIKCDHCGHTFEISNHNNYEKWCLSGKRCPECDEHVNIISKSCGHK